MTENLVHIEIDDRATTLDKKIKDLDIEIFKQTEIINKSRNVGAKNSAKQRALQLLKQKKTYESQRNQLMQHSFNMGQVCYRHRFIGFFMTR